MIRLPFILAAVSLAVLIACGSDPTATPESAVAPGPTSTTTAPASGQPTTGTEETTSAAEEASPSTEAASLVRLSAADIPPCVGSTGGRIGDCAPEFMGTQEWINSDPLTLDNLRGNVVLIDFWTYTCVNCIRTLPFLQEWYDRYADEGLVIVGVHTPEFEFEKIFDNVVEATKDEEVVWPVVQDNDFAVWRSYSNRYWPAKYLIDQAGVIRYTHFGEGKYAETEEMIRKLLEEGGMPRRRKCLCPRTRAGTRPSCAKAETSPVSCLPDGSSWRSRGVAASDKERNTSEQPELLPRLMTRLV